MSDNENKMDDFETWHAGLNKLVDEKGQPILMSDAFDTKAVLATPQEVQDLQSKAWLEKWDATKPRFEDENGEAVTLNTPLNAPDV